MLQCTSATSAAVAHRHAAQLSQSICMYWKECLMCRQAKVEMAPAGSVLRMAGSALLVSGSLEDQACRDSKEQAGIEGPCLLPPRPAVYTCLSKIRVRSASMLACFMVKLVHSWWRPWRQVDMVQCSCPPQTAGVLLHS